MEKRYLVMWMWLCEGKLKVKSVHFRLPSASQKRACLSSLFIDGIYRSDKECICFMTCSQYSLPDTELWEGEPDAFYQVQQDKLQNVHYRPVTSQHFPSTSSGFYCVRRVSLTNLVPLLDQPSWIQASSSLFEDLIRKLYTRKKVMLFNMNVT